MESVLTEMIKQAPAVGALVYVVMTFLRHIRDSDATREKLLEKRDEALQHLGDNCHRFQQEMAAKNETSFGKVSAALDRNTEVLGRACRTIDSFDEYLALHKTRGKTN